MRIALVCPYSWSRPGGVQRHVAGLAAALRGRGLDVDVLAPWDGGEPVTGLVAVGRSVPIPDNASIVPVALSPAAAARTARALARGGYDLVHVHEPVIPTVSLAATLRARAPLVGTFHMYAAQPRWYRPFAPLCRYAVSRLSARIAVSDAAAHHASRTCPGAYHVIPNGIDFEALAGEAGERDPNMVLFVGRAEPRKGLPILLEAFKRLPGEPVLELAGVSAAELGPAGVELPPAVVHRIRPRGVVADEERNTLLARAAVLCVPSLEGESFGVVLLEGMAAGVPVVASALPSYAAVLPPSAGRLVPPRDAAALAAALTDLLADDVLRARLGREGRRIARRYDWSHVSREVLAVYEDVLARPRPQRSRSRLEAAYRPPSRRRSLA